MFWLISLLVLVASGLLALLPLLGKDARRKPLAIVVILLLPLAGYLLYQQVGTPRALDPDMVRAPVQTAEQPAPHAGDTDLGTLTERLRQRLEANPDDVQGWVLLGRSYKNLQDFPKAIEALETAQRLSPGMPLVQVELVEAQLFASNDPKFTPEMVATLEQAVTAEPPLQKGLWLLGIAAAQDGDDARALGWWEKLHAQLEPGSPIEQSLSEQIDEVRARLGQSPAAEPSSVPGPTAMPATSTAAAVATPTTPATETAAEGMEIRVELSAAASQSWPQLSAGATPPGAVLFIIARPEGAAGGPPVGVRRMDQPQFPLQLTLTDADSMVPQRPISSVERLELQARLSLSGSPGASAGDWQNVSVTVARDAAALTTLILDQKVE